MPSSPAPTVRRVAILGGNRIPFARADGPYATASNQQMLGAALAGLVDRFGLRGELLGEFVAGAVLKQAATSTWPARPSSAARSTRAPPPTTSSRPAAPGWRRRSWSPTRSRSARSTAAWPGASTPRVTPRSASTTSCGRCCSRCGGRGGLRAGSARWPVRVRAT